MSEKLPSKPGGKDIAAFVAEARSLAAVGSGRADSARLIIGIDATQSREATWDLASGLQMQMFEAAASHGGLCVQLVYFRGLDECRASRWHDQARPLVDAMERVRCRAGHTQIARVLRHALRERTSGKVAALVLIGDACEEEADEVVGLAGQLAMVSVPVFAFHEGPDPGARALFQEIARVTRGAFHRFDHSAPRALADALRAVAVYASGGDEALQRLAAQEGGAFRQIASQVGR
ncbi:hypothetical protein [Geminicoccus roseus]|uniref:hypothetical protein n=1 Tax=Geminicoccus roseus TaxID=404900 RepID=UPI0004256385|nr:hypothetical protein [Geminicoccus roseus]